MSVEKRVCATAHGGGIPVLNDPRASSNPTAYNQTELLSSQWTIAQIQSRTTCPRNVNALQDIPGICPNISANPPRVSRSGFILVCKKGLSWKKSVLIPWVMGGIKTPKSCEEEREKANIYQQWEFFSLISRNRKFWKMCFKRGNILNSPLLHPDGSGW